MSRLTNPPEQALANTIGAGLLTARKATGLTQAETASLCGLAPEVYGRYERGQQLPSVPMLAKLLMTLHAEPNAVLGLGPSNAPRPGKPLPLPMAAFFQGLQNTTNMRRLLRAARHLQPRQLRLVAQLAEQLASK